MKAVKLFCVSLAQEKCEHHAQLAGTNRPWPTWKSKDCAMWILYSLTQHH